jgi:uncharacterized protein
MYRSPDDYYEEALRLARAGCSDAAQITDLITTAAETGCERACVRLGADIEAAAASHQDVLAALAWYRRAAERGCAEAGFQLGRLLADCDLVADALPWLQSARDVGDNRARVWIAMLVDDLGVRDEATGSPVAVYAELRDTVAQAKVRLAYCLLLGKGVAADREAAGALFTELDRDGHAHGAHGLGLIEREARGMEHALPWFERAAERGLAVACFLCGEHLAQGVRTEAAARQALPYLRRAAAFRLPEAMAVLAGMQLRGRGCDRDPVAAFALLQEATALGDSYAMLLLAIQLHRGDGVPMDRRAAVHWCRRAAALGLQVAVDKLRQWGVDA